MESKGLLFIPDISGFSRFVTETEIGHSRLIIQELLEVLIESNEIGLEISEIEGDAILFYKYGDPPPTDLLYRQVEKMFCAFHKNLLAYAQRRYCQCNACTTASALTLKVITHYGEFTGYRIQNFSKLIGKGVIVAHQLLKNDISRHEYWIITSNLTGGSVPVPFAGWMQWASAVKHSDTGDIPFHYTQLTDLKKHLAPDRISHDVLEKRKKVLSLTKDYDTDIITLFHATGDFQYRNRWHDGVRNVEIIDHFLPRVGMKFKCVMEGKEVFIYSTSYRYQDDRIEFSETDEKRKNTLWFVLERIETKHTRLTLEYYIGTTLAEMMSFPLFRRRKVEQQLRKSMDNLVGLVKELRIPSGVQG